MQKKAKVALDEGYIFGEEGRGFERINVASPRSVIEECMNGSGRHLKRKNWYENSGENDSERYF